jgi:hypothetical protein
VKVCAVLVVTVSRPAHRSREDLVLAVRSAIRHDAVDIPGIVSLDHSPCRLFLNLETVSVKEMAPDNALCQP